jgi:hypothetical protein
MINTLIINILANKRVFVTFIENIFNKVIIDVHLSTIILVG